MRAAIPFLALVLAGAAVAQTPPAQTRPAAPAARKFPGVSDAGNAILTKAMSARDPDYIAALKALRTYRETLAHFVMSPPIDPDKLAALLKQGEEAQAQVRQRQDDLIVAAMRELSDTDRAAFVRTLVPAPVGAVPPPR